MNSGGFSSSQTCQAAPTENAIASKDIRIGANGSEDVFWFIPANGEGSELNGFAAVAAFIWSGIRVDGF